MLKKLLRKLLNTASEAPSSALETSPESPETRLLTGTPTDQNTPGTDKAVSTRRSRIEELPSIEHTPRVVYTNQVHKTILSLAAAEINNGRPVSKSERQKALQDALARKESRMKVELQEYSEKAKKKFDYKR